MARVQKPKGKPVKGVNAKLGTEWLKPGLIGARSTSSARRISGT